MRENKRRQTPHDVGAGTQLLCHAIRPTNDKRHSLTAIKTPHEFLRERRGIPGAATLIQQNNDVVTIELLCDPPGFFDPGQVFLARRVRKELPRHIERFAQPFGVAVETFCDPRFMFFAHREHPDCHGNILARPRTRLT